MLKNKKIKKIKKEKKRKKKANPCHAHNQEKKKKANVGKQKLKKKKKKKNWGYFCQLSKSHTLSIFFSFQRENILVGLGKKHLCPTTFFFSLLPIKHIPKSSLIFLFFFHFPRNPLCQTHPQYAMQHRKTKCHVKGDVLIKKSKYMTFNVHFDRNIK